MKFTGAYYVNGATTPAKPQEVRTMALAVVRLPYRGVLFGSLALSVSRRIHGNGSETRDARRLTHTNGSPPNTYRPVATRKQLRCL